MPWEVVNPNVRRGRFRAAVFDFDGTLSLVREGWSAIMANLGLDLLREQHLPVEATAVELLEEEMLRLSGKPSIFQMRRLAEIIAGRGGTAPDPEQLLAEFLKRLLATAGGRKDRLAMKVDPPAAWAVQGAHAVIENLLGRGVAVYLASGTDYDYVLQEAELLDLTKYFGKHIYAPADNTPNFSKRDVISMILREHGCPGEELIGFGDGYSETVEVKRAGGVAVGLATVEAGVPGLNRMKRTMLIEHGADVVIPDYAEQEQLVAWLFAD